MQYGSHWTGVGIQEAVKRGFDVIDLYGEDATQDKVFAAIETYRPEVVIIAGHGNPGTVTCQELAVLLKACQNDEIMTGTISHFLSCSVGQLLLPSLITKGANWTIGYAVDFQFMINPEFAIEEDPVALPFREVTVEIIKKILDGAKLKDTWNAGIAKCDEWINKLWNSTDPYAADMIACLKHNKSGMIGLGSEEAYIPTRITITASGQILLLAGLAWVFLTG